MKEHVILIKEDSTCRVVPFEHSTTQEELHRLQQLVGGYIETVPCKGQNFIMLVDEEGTFKDYHVNGLASEATRYNAVIMGKAVIAQVAVNDEGEQLICGMGINEAVEYLTDLAQKLNHTIHIEVGGDTECCE